MRIEQVVPDRGQVGTKAVAYPGFFDEQFTVAGSPQTVFSLATNIDTAHALDVAVAGRAMDPRSAFTVDATANTVTLSEAVAIGVWVRVRLYLK